MKENGFKLVKERSRRYPAQIIIGVDYTDKIALLANAPAQAETLLHSLKWVAGGIGIHVNADKNTCALIKEATCKVHLPQKKRFINRKRHQHTTSKGIDSFQ